MIFNILKKFKFKLILFDEIFILHNYFLEHFQNHKLFQIVHLQYILLHLHDHHEKLLVYIILTMNHDMLIGHYIYLNNNHLICLVFIVLGHRLGKFQGAFLTYAIAIQSVPLAPAQPACENCR
jgi:hypothetical protein